SGGVGRADGRRKSQRPRVRAVGRAIARAGRRNRAGALREAVHGRRWHRSVTPPAGAPRAARRDRARLQLYRSADARPLRERDPVRSRARCGRAARVTKTWFERSPVLAALEEAERRNVPVLLTTDHGAIH